MPKVLVTTFPFGEHDPLPLSLLKKNGIEYVVNPLQRKLTEDELGILVSDFDVLIAGTEIISENVMKNAKNLSFISRVGVGLDGVDLMAARRRGIKVSYTPEAPAPAVAELTIGLMLSMLRHIHIADAENHSGHWHRHFGRRLSEMTIGVIGFGRIGTRVVKHLSGFGQPNILLNDISSSSFDLSSANAAWAEKSTIFEKADIITLHVPLTQGTRNMINREQLSIMKKNSIIINTSRGGIVNEDDLAAALDKGYLAGAAIDVFTQEPYSGPLAKSGRCLLTSHMGSMTFDCRSRMEIEATEEAVRFCTGQTLISQVPDFEYELQGLGT